MFAVPDEFDSFLSGRVEDEAVVDRGASYVKHVCDEEEVEGRGDTPITFFSLSKVYSFSFTPPPPL